VDFDQTVPNPAQRRVELGGVLVPALLEGLAKARASKLLSWDWIWALTS
jgi:hypothetical protein